MSHVFDYVPTDKDLKKAGFKKMPFFRRYERVCPECLMEGRERYLCEYNQEAFCPEHGCAIVDGRSLQPPHCPNCGLTPNCDHSSFELYLWENPGISKDTKFCPRCGTEIDEELRRQARIYRATVLDYVDHWIRPEWMANKLG